MNGQNAPRKNAKTASRNANGFFFFILWLDTSISEWE